MVEGLGGVVNAAIGQFTSRLLALLNAVLLLRVGFAAEGQGLVSFSGRDRGIGRFVALAEEREFHGGDSIVGALLWIETAACGQLFGTNVCFCSRGGVIWLRNSASKAL